jgi:hypothetical protein
LARIVCGVRMPFVCGRYWMGGDFVTWMPN